MTTREFAQKYDVKRTETVEGWIGRGFLPKTVRDPESGEWDIPEGSLPPYIHARAKKEDSVYVSIVRACKSGRAVFAGLYGMSEERFARYVGVAQEAGLIEAYTTESGLTQFVETPKGDEFLRQPSKRRREIILDAVRTAAAVGAAALPLAAKLVS